MLAYQIAFDLYENASQQFIREIEKALIPAREETTTDGTTATTSTNETSTATTTGTTATTSGTTATTTGSTETSSETTSSAETES